MGAVAAGERETEGAALKAGEEAGIAKAAAAAAAVERIAEPEGAAAVEGGL